ncbi:PP2C family serine/threonine-protein phosphatase [Rhodococcus sp. LW-XY12]|uniref:PP2C family protein-serine/threonine phosphatase n=1 Tax=Rhodococcus sp. LW-XY12 TaxID=2856851 RepID=UPI001C559FC1|nr:PP2C family serine/threonine-protein phosphatase [Rhodococcus sp. LW-XY12]QXU56636.1 serine/threonine-protein phosphatase [Rhodococcus sp. LW-XY12]
MALGWAAFTGLLVYICAAIPFVRDHARLVVWIALMVLPGLTLAWHTRRSKVAHDHSDQLTTGDERPTEAIQSQRHRDPYGPVSRVDRSTQIPGADHSSPPNHTGRAPSNVDDDDSTVSYRVDRPTAELSARVDGAQSGAFLSTSMPVTDRRRLILDLPALQRRPGSLVFSAYSATHEGMRTSNQDFALVTPVLLGIADGVGGRSHGAQASKVALESVARSLTKDPDVSLTDAVDTSNSDLRRLLGDQSDNSPATTLDLVHLDETGDLTGAHVGDSRVGVLAYQSNHVDWLTTDHASGNNLTLSVGSRPNIRPDIWLHSVEPGDLVIVATDGLWDTPHGASDAEHLLVEHRRHAPQEIAHALVQAAVRGGTQDNVTVVIGRVERVARR